MAYNKKTWNDGEVITKNAINNIENGIKQNETDISKKMNMAPSNGTSGQFLKSNGTEIPSWSNIPDATKTVKGVVKQATLVPDASGENVTKAEFKVLLDALKTAGIMSNS